MSPGNSSLFLHSFPISYNDKNWHVDMFRLLYGLGFLNYEFRTLAQAASDCAPSVEVLPISDVAANKAECGNTARMHGPSSLAGSYKRLGYNSLKYRQFFIECANIFAHLRTCRRPRIPQPRVSNARSYRSPTLSKAVCGTPLGWVPGPTLAEYCYFAVDKVASNKLFPVLNSGDENESDNQLRLDDCVECERFRSLDEARFRAESLAERGTEKKEERGVERGKRMTRGGEEQSIELSGVEDDAFPPGYPPVSRWKRDDIMRCEYVFSYREKESTNTFEKRRLKRSRENLIYKFARYVEKELQEQCTAESTKLTNTGETRSSDIPTFLLTVSLPIVF
ncbi:hypothetical protein WN51_02234 [Melipona quadrifasciata]|uniref:Uncharacterized protein n=1 Tax=Melipona quadrifasciata TaxID=166423 RepID=A0A0M8ZTH4_9HYME|nr:hypothetical protein WN51_02234 [Melipona quadrifasciata]